MTAQHIHQYPPVVMDWDADERVWFARVPDLDNREITAPDRAALALAISAARREHEAQAVPA